MQPLGLLQDCAPTDFMCPFFARYCFTRGISFHLFRVIFDYRQLPGVPRAHAESSDPERGIKPLSAFFSGL